nr:hypothetical protein [Candidatus Aenigmarchaeota archaeon]
MKKKILIILLIILGVSVLGIGGFFIYKNYFSKKTEETTSSQVRTEALKLDPQKEATHLSKVMGTEGVYWMRGFPVVWNNIERKKGKFDWSSTDIGIQGKDDYFSGDVYHIAMIWPYANWDQDACHQGEKYEATGHLKESDENLKMGAPCDMQAYANFLEKVVERYDGDGTNDMPGLSIPIKYWEIMNEPSMQGGSIGGAGEDLKFFVGTSQEYFEILKTSYETIKKADPEAKVAHAGMAGMQQNFQDFWGPVFAAGAGNYFDIANIHTISTDERREDLYVIKFKRYLEKYGIKNKPIWITEVQFGDLMEKPDDLKSFEKLLAKASVFALAQGADKLFYIENWATWDNKEFFEPPKNDDKEKKEPKPKIDLTDNSTHKVYLNLVDKINHFDKIEVLQEKYEESPGDHDGTTCTIGHYKFISGSKAIYVLWGKDSAVSPEISGKLKVTDIYGNVSEIDATSLILSDEP